MVNSAIDPAIEWGREILGFVDAAVLHDPDELPIARDGLFDTAGPEVVREVAGVIATFEMMNRLLDSTGAPVHDFLGEITAELGLEVPPHLRGSPG